MTGPTRFHRGVTTILTGVVMLAPAPASALQQPTAASPAPGLHRVRVQYNVMVPMRDGVRLSTDIYRPDEEGRFPVVLTRDPYSSGVDFGMPEQGQFWASHGYVFLHQDVRGRFDSEGSWYPFVSEGLDGADACAWAARQPWSSGKIATNGVSYLAYDQWQLAAQGCPDLVTIMPTFSPLALYRDIHPGGAFELTRIAWATLMAGRTMQAFKYDWGTSLAHLPLLTMARTMGHRSTWWRDLVLHPSDDGYWQPLDMKARLPDLDLPVEAIGGWFDTFLSSTLAAYAGMTRAGAAHRADQRMIIGPWIHGGHRQHLVGEMDFGASASMRLDSLELTWTDAWLRGESNGVGDQAPIELFVMGRNQWQNEREWPPAGSKPARFYLHSGGSANSAVGDGSLSSTAPADEPSDRFEYDPLKPVPTLGGSLPGANPDLHSGMYDQQEIERRPDVLVYSTPPLATDVEAIGPVEVVLYAATDAKDTDFTAKLVDVHPDGRAFNLVDGIVRARYRSSVRQPSWVEPGAVVEYRIDLVATANVFLRGHRIRVEISSSNFPRFSRNLNTGEPLATGERVVTAKQTVFHDRRHASYLGLTVVPAK
jgi:uncharacterized protein